MTTHTFHDRQSEPETLDRLYCCDTDGQMIVLSGRWRIGKTALINQ